MIQFMITIPLISTPVPPFLDYLENLNYDARSFKTNGIIMARGRSRAHDCLAVPGSNAWVNILPIHSKN